MTWYRWQRAVDVGLHERVVGGSLKRVDVGEELDA
jgi:hypothetical protein